MIIGIMETLIERNALPRTVMLATLDQAAKNVAAAGGPAAGEAAELIRTHRHP
jgi:hypothetical protein